MNKDRPTVTRREFIRRTAAGTAVLASGVGMFPHIARAADPVKIGLVHPVTGFLQNCNSAPQMTTDGENPRKEDYPPYMIGDEKVTPPSFR